ncbi:MAG: hypothetical protein M3353_07205 [Actinomycetota bacterium]|nr:hypothetical protein [Actinomycetota bacterium]
MAAAEIWAQSGDSLVEDLHREVEAARREFKAREDEDYAERARVHREQYGDLGRDGVVVLADRRRRRIAEARKPRPGDYPGRAS